MSLSNLLTQHLQTLRQGLILGDGNNIGSNKPVIINNRSIERPVLSRMGMKPLE